MLFDEMLSDEMTYHHYFTSQMSRLSMFPTFDVDMVKHKCQLTILAAGGGGSLSAE